MAPLTMGSSVLMNFAWLKAVEISSAAAEMTAFIRSLGSRLSSLPAEELRVLDKLETHVCLKSVEEQIASMVLDEVRSGLEGEVEPLEPSAEKSCRLATTPTTMTRRSATELLATTIFFLLCSLSALLRSERAPKSWNMVDALRFERKIAARLP